MPRWRVPRLWAHRLSGPQKDHGQGRHIQAQNMCLPGSPPGGSVRCFPHSSSAGISRRPTREPGSSLFPGKLVVKIPQVPTGLIWDRKGKFHGDSRWRSLGHLLLQLNCTFWTSLSWAFYIPFPSDDRLLPLHLNIWLGGPGDSWFMMEAHRTWSPESPWLSVQFLQDQKLLGKAILRRGHRLTPESERSEKSRF